MSGDITMLEVPSAKIPATLKDRGIDRAIVWATPMRMRFRRIEVREGILLHGPCGWGEVSPFWDYDAAESAAWLRAGIELATTELPAGRREQIPVNVTVPVCDPQLAFERVRESGCATAKVKVADPGSSLDQDCERLVAVRQALGPAGKIRVDANQAWTEDAAVAAIARLERAAQGLEYVEQPCASVEELSAVRRRVQVRIAADESVRRAADPLRVARAEAADLLVIKMQPLGGAGAALRLCEQAGLPVVVSSALDSAVGIWGAAALAAALPQLPYACGLATGNLLRGDTCLPVNHPRGAVSTQVPQLDEAAVMAQPDSVSGRDLLQRWVSRLQEMSGQVQE